MRRVFAVIGFSSFFASLICIFFGKTFQLAAIIACIILILLLAINKITRRLSILYVMFITILISSVNVMLFDGNAQNITEKYCDKPVEIEAELIEQPTESEKGFSYFFRLCGENNVNFSLYTHDSLYIQPGDKIKGVFDFDDTYADFTQRDYFSAYLYNTDKINTVENKDEFNLQKIRSSLKQRIVDNTTYGRSITIAVVFGDKTRISDDLYYDLLRCGLLHATATSGLHLTIVTGFLFAFLSFIGISRKKSAICAIVFIILFMFVIGFKFSLMRAGIMMIMYFAANLFDREGDSFNSIGLATAVLVAINPYTVINCSFLLSASATIGLLIMFSPMYSKIQSMCFGKFGVIIRFVMSLVASGLQSVCAIIFTLPVAYIFFGYFSVAGIVANMVLYLFISFVLISGVAICLLADLPYIPNVLGKLNDISSLIIIKVSGFISRFKYCLINIDYDFLAIWFAICSVIIAAGIILYYFYKTEKKITIKICSVLCADVLLLAVLLHIIIPDKRYEMLVQNSGGAINLTTVANNNTIVIDMGGKYCERRVKATLTNKCRDKISYLIVPGYNDEDSAAAQNISCSIDTENVIINTEKFDSLRYKIKGKTISINNCSYIKLGELRISFINQQNTTVLHITNGESSVLVLDENACCRQIPKKYTKCDTVLISKSCPVDIDFINAKQAVIFSYEEKDEQKAAELFDTYSLRKGSMTIKFDDKIALRGV